jgi:hypothetical protein
MKLKINFVAKKYYTMTFLNGKRYDFSGLRKFTNILYLFKKFFNNKNDVLEVQVFDRKLKNPIGIIRIDF